MAIFFYDYEEILDIAKNNDNQKLKKGRQDSYVVEPFYTKLEFNYIQAFYDRYMFFAKKFDSKKQVLEYCPMNKDTGEITFMDSYKRSSIFGDMNIEFAILFNKGFHENNRGLSILINADQENNYVLYTAPMLKCKMPEKIGHKLDNTLPLKKPNEIDIKLENILKFDEPMKHKVEDDYDNIRNKIEARIEFNDGSAEYREKLRQHKECIKDIIQDDFEQKYTQYKQFKEIIETAKAETDTHLVDLEDQALKEFMYEPQILFDLHEQTYKITNELAPLINGKNVDSKKAIDCFEIYCNNVANKMFSEISHKFEDRYSSSSY